VVFATAPLRYGPVWDEGVYLGHKAGGFAEGDGDALVVLLVVEGVRCATGLGESRAGASEASKGER